MKATKAIIVAGLLVSTLTACTSATGTENSSPSPSATENPYGGFAVDSPGKNETILTIIGPKETDEYSITDLGKLETQSVSIKEPFLKVDQTFTGVPLKTLFEAAGISDGDKLSTVALNDYKFDDKAGNFTDAQGYLAIERDGKEIPMDQGGPIRIVFPSQSKYFDYLDAWNWSIRTISVIK